VSSHPAVSVAILRPLEYLGVVRELILSHHERWDGTGYPRGLAGEAIPLGARILAVVDAWQSLTVERPFRAAREAAEAVAELRREAGRQFDADVVEALVRVLDREGRLRECGLSGREGAQAGHGAAPIPGGEVRPTAAGGGAAGAGKGTASPGGRDS